MQKTAEHLSTISFKSYGIDDIELVSRKFLAKTDVPSCEAITEPHYRTTQSFRPVLVQIAQIALRTFHRLWISESVQK